MHVLGIDPGTAHTAWVVLDVDATSARWVQGQVGALLHTDVEPIVSAHEVALVAIELPTLRKFAAAQCLVDTAFIAGKLYAWADSTQADVLAITSYDWRAWLTGRPAAKDSAIAEAVGRMVSGLPRRTNCHLRDAAGLALYAGRQALGLLGHESELRGCMA